MTKEEELYNLISSKGSGEYENYHIIFHVEDNIRFIYRVYHSDGYCIDVVKYYNYYLGEVEEVDYIVYDEWEGFEKGDLETYINLFK